LKTASECGNHHLIKFTAPTSEFKDGMKYTLCDLGKPCEKLMGKAFINTSTGENLFVKGGWFAILRYLDKMECGFIGKAVMYSCKTGKQVAVYPIASNNIKIKQLKRGFEFRSKSYDLLLKWVRRFPNKWIPELSVDVEGTLSVSTTFLREKGFDLSAELIETALKRTRQVKCNENQREMYGSPGYRVNVCR
jgi:hypothetical protein